MTCPMCDGYGYKDYAWLKLEQCDCQRPFVAPRPQEHELHSAYLSRVVTAFEQHANALFARMRDAQTQRSVSPDAALEKHKNCGKKYDGREWHCATGHKDFCPTYRQTTVMRP